MPLEGFSRLHAFDCTLREATFQMQIPVSILNEFFATRVWIKV